MSAPYSLDDVARTSDDAAVVARFDASTLTALRVLSAAFAFVTLPHITQATTAFQNVLGSLAFIAAALMFAVVRKRAANTLARAVKRRVRGSAIVFVLFETAALIVFGATQRSESAVVLATLIPIAAILIRLRPAEHVLLHGSIAAIFLAVVMTMPYPNQKVGQVIAPAILFNALSLAAALLVSRRQRRGIVAEWTERRTSAREQIRMRDELRYARELQLSMLPESAPRLDWVEMSGVSVPATEVGGDYYDFLVDGGCVAVVCLDVAGHGMASGLVLSAVRGALTVMRDVRDPLAMLQRLHQLVLRNSRRRMLVTMSIVLLDRDAQRAVVASAAHPPVIVRRGDGSVETIELPAPPLGVHLPVTLRKHETPFAAGDTFVLHSDGVYEARNAAGETYGFDRLRQVIAAHGGSSAGELRDAIIGDVAAFRGTEEQHDDVTVVVCRISPRV